MRTWCNWVTHQSTKLISVGSSPSVLALSPGSSVGSSVCLKNRRSSVQAGSGGLAHCPIAQLAEQAAVNREAVGSIPTGAAIYWEVGKQAKPSHFECEV